MDDNGWVPISLIAEFPRVSLLDIYSYVLFNLFIPSQVITMSISVVLKQE